MLRMIFSVLWNFLVYCFDNKVEICVLLGVLKFFVKCFNYFSFLGNIFVVESSGGILRNFFFYIVV